MGSKKSGDLRVLDKCDSGSLSEDKPNDLPSSTTETKTKKGSQKKINTEEVAKALGASHYHLLGETPIEVDLGLDISSSITGAVLLDKQGFLVFMGHVPLTSTKYTNLFQKADATIEWMKLTLPRSVKVTRIFVEANAKGYSAGFSSAETLFTLAKMNALVSYLAHKWYGVPVIDINVTSARSRIGYKNVKAVKKPVKEKVRDFVLLNNPHLPFKTRVVTIGKHKGCVVPVAGAADEIDSWVVCRGGQILHP